MRKIFSTYKLAGKTKNDSRTNFLDIMKLIITVLLWASIFPAIRAILAYFTPGHMVLLRFIVASVLLAVYAIITRMPLPTLLDIQNLAPASFLGIVVYQLATAYGEITVNSGTASVLVNTIPIFTALFASIFNHERLKFWGWIGIVISFAGIVLIALNGGQELRFSPGVVLLILAAISFSSYSVLQDKHLGSDENSFLLRLISYKARWKAVLARFAGTWLHPALQVFLCEFISNKKNSRKKDNAKKYTFISFTAYTMWIGTFFLLVYSPGLIGQVYRTPISITLLIVYLGALPTVGAYLMWGDVLTRMGVSRTTSFLYLVPPLTFPIAWIWLGEIPTFLSLVGSVIVFGGVIMVFIFSEEKKESKER